MRVWQHLSLYLSQNIKGFYPSSAEKGECLKFYMDLSFMIRRELIQLKIIFNYIERHIHTFCSLNINGTNLLHQMLLQKINVLLNLWPLIHRQLYLLCKTNIVTDVFCGAVQFVHREAYNIKRNLYNAKPIPKFLNSDQNGPFQSIYICMHSINQ